MGLNFSEALRLSWSNIAEHKKRSVAIIVTISILFGAIMGFNFMLQGLRNTVLDVALQANEGKIYLETGYQNISSINEGDFTELADLEAAQKIVRDTIAYYHGKIIGEITTYQVGSTRWVINQAVADAIGEIELNLDELNPDQIPFLAPEFEIEYFQGYLWDNGEKDKRLVKVGTYPSTKHGSPTLPGFNPLNLLLGRVYGSADSYPLIIDDGSGKVTNHINSMAQRQVDQYGYESVAQVFEVWPPEKYYIAVFDSYDDAVVYYNAYGDNSPKLIQIDEKKYSILNMDIFGRVIYLELDFNNLQFMLTAIEVLFIIIAILIATFTFAHLIDQDAATIALYRSLGASTGNIYLIYFLYLVELCLLAVLSCVMIAFVFAGVMWLFNAGALAERLKEYYILKDLPKVNLFGFNGMFFWTIGSIMIIAPISLVLTLRRFSAKHIAKKLKED